MITSTVQRWNERRPRFKPAGAVIDPKSYEVAEISEDQAKAFVQKHHYSGTYPAARRRFGLFRAGSLVGAAVFSHPVNERTITNVFGCERAADGLELHQERGTARPPLSKDQRSKDMISRFDDLKRGHRCSARTRPYEVDPATYIFYTAADDGQEETAEDTDED